MAGSFAESGSSECSTCGSGTYQAGVESASCLPCPAGRALPPSNDPTGHDGVEDCSKFFIFMLYGIYFYFCNFY